MAVPDRSEALWLDYGYDIETYKNIYSVEITHIATNTRWIFEVSDRVNQSAEFVKFMDWLASIGARMVGFNNEGFDYLVVHHLIAIFRQTGTFDAEDAYQKTKQLFALDWNDRFGVMIWPNERLVKQLDLFKIHHFDNVARSTSLKKLEIAMRSKTVKDLPYDPDIPLSFEQMTVLVAYMGHDVSETIKFYMHSLAQIKFRDELSEKYTKDFTNFNDTKIGKEFFKMELEKVLPGITGTSKNPNKTMRSNIAVGDILLPYIQFASPEFNGILEFFRQANLKTKPNGVGDFKGFFKGLQCNVGGITFKFGAGGIHASVHGRKFAADAEYDIIDVDVASYYPSLAIANKFFPMHLTEAFCPIYKDVFDMRRSYDKKTAENAMLKLALNGVYGESNAAHGAFLDPQYTMAITINGQLLIAMLSEWVMSIPGVELIQANTDGITCRVHKSVRAQFKATCDHWMKLTDLILEDVDYSRMFVRDVNNYIGEYKESGKLKRIGAYMHVTPLDDPYTREVQWHKNHSALVVPKAAEAALVRGVDPVTFINAHSDPFDFMVSQKVPRSMDLFSTQAWWALEGYEKKKGWQEKPWESIEWELNEWEVPIGHQTIYQNTCRYFISNEGKEMYKHMPPLPSKPMRERYNTIEKGYLVEMCDDADDFDWVNLNRQYYIDEANKLINCIH